MVRFPLHDRPTRTDHVRFIDGSTSDYKPPVNTMDPRFAACTDHRVACDCREADLREDIVEYRTEYLLLKAAIESVVSDHPTFLDGPGREEPGCRCTGCQILRLAHDKDFWKTAIR